MNTLLVPRLKLAAKTISKIITKPSYLMITIVASLIALGLILWALNIDLLYFVFFQTNLSFGEKISFFVSVYGAIFSSYSNPQALSMLIFSVLLGVNISVLIHTIRNVSLRKSLHKSSAAGFGFAVIGGSCAACGTSIIAPLLLSLGLGGSLAFTTSLGITLNVMGSLLVIFSLYKLGLINATATAKKNLE